MTHLLQIQRGINFLEAHLGSELQLTDISRAAGMSHWHFQRMFRALTQETLKGYVRSRRLSWAHAQVKTTEMDLLEIALQSGFRSQASFTRAFKTAYGEPPGRTRRRGEAHLVPKKLRIDADYLRHLHGGVSLDPELHDQNQKHLVGLCTSFYGVESERNNLGERLPPLWEAFLPRLEEIPSSIAGICYGVIEQPDLGDERLLYTAAIEVAHKPTVLPPGMSQVTVPAGTYAQFTHHGWAASIDRTVDYVYSGWLLRSGRRHSYGPDLEIYDHRFRGDSPDSCIGYAIPLLP